MLKQLNADQLIEENWPCLFCDDWSHDFMRISENILRCNACVC